MQLDLDIIKTPTGFLKICESVLTLLILSIGQGAVRAYGSHSRDFFVGGTVILSFVVTPSLLFSYLNGNTQIQKTLLEFEMNVILAVMMLTAGSLIINTYTAIAPYRSKNIRDAALTAGSFGIINSVFYGVDAFFAFENYMS